MQLFLHFCNKNSIKAPTKEQIDSFYTFTEHLLTVNQTTNLTAIRDVPSTITKHHLDSLLASDLIPQGARVLDIGCGPGFPTLPLAIVRPDIHITALDSTQKKINFVAESAKLLHLSNIEAISARAEDHDVLKQLGSFDIVISRAVARLNILCELALPYVRINGAMIAMKAAKADEELEAAQNAIKILGGDTATIHKSIFYTSDDTQEERALIRIKKIKQTPTLYPRAFATIKKKEL